MFLKIKTDLCLRTFLLSALLFLSATVSSAKTYYVVHNADTENPSGESWSTAFPNLQDAINTAATNGGGQVWVKAGIYKPGDLSRNASFELKPNVSIYGGFRGGEKTLDQRIFKANRTILSGDIGRSGSVSDNCYHILKGASGSRIDGFIISRGNANSAAENRFGGGIYFPPDTKQAIVANCTFEKNNAEIGGAILLEQSEVSISNCTFYSNSAETGGAIATLGASSLQVTNSIFSSNYAPASGGAIALDSEAEALFYETSFLYNSTDGLGGAVVAATEDKAGIALEMSNCTFSENSARTSGGALSFSGPFQPQIMACKFERNFSSAGAGAVANANGIMAVIIDSTFTENRGIQGSKNIGNDFTSIVADSKEEIEKLAKLPENRRSFRQHAPKPKPVEKPKEEPKPARKIGDEFVYDAQNTKVKLRSIVADEAYTVLALGDLTDPEFIKAYREIEAAAVDHATNSVSFYYIYRYLLHPENNGYVQPLNEKERKRQSQLASQFLSTKIPWLCDVMDNQTAKALSPNAYNGLFIYDATGQEIYAGPISKPTDFRKALAEKAGNVDIPTPASTLPEPTIEPMASPEVKFVKRVTVDAKKERFEPLQLTPLASKAPHYVKVRIEGDKEVRETGDGKIYLGFHIDPLYNISWNNLGEPLRYALKVPAGVVAPSINSAPRVSAEATDSEPREFLLNARKLDINKPIALQITYSVHSIAAKRNSEVTQKYMIYLQPDPFGGKVFGRQHIVSTKPVVAVNPAGSSAFKAMLRRYDLDRNGKLTDDEVIGGLSTNFKLIDTNEDGAIDEEEYMFYRETQ